MEKLQRLILDCSPNIPDKITIKNMSIVFIIRRYYDFIILKKDVGTRTNQIKRSVNNLQLFTQEIVLFECIGAKLRSVLFSLQNEWRFLYEECK